MEEIAKMFNDILYEDLTDLEQNICHLLARNDLVRYMGDSVGHLIIKSN